MRYNGDPKPQGLLADGPKTIPSVSIKSLTKIPHKLMCMKLLLEICLIVY